jgi:hypothetical protein
MSIDFRTYPPIRMADLFNGRLKDFGVHECRVKNAPTHTKCLTDGHSDLWVYGDEEGRAWWFTSYGLHDPLPILEAISAAFDVDIEIIDIDYDMGRHDEPPPILRAPSRRGIESQAQR